ncbi:MAG TPA: SigB/SigF/SigG family RNA polymerase sigma factor [Solirubrobacterales bacterium]|nr:SigB/SigF/SigG family RNA polymerase sigma factor [Solirubrobacterales bacterium]
MRRYKDDGDQHARDALVDLMLPWVRRIALRYVNRGHDLDDLIQVGCVGLLKAIERFDFGRGTQLSTFAEPNVSGEIKRYFRDHGWTVRPPRDLQELNAGVTKAIDTLTSRHQRTPTISEIADFMNSSTDDVLEAIHAGAGYESAPLATEEEPESTHSALASVDKSLARTELRATLHQGMETLSERDKLIVHMRFFEDLTQSEIAEAVGVSQMQVSRILRSSLQKIRADLARGTDETV